MRGVLLTEHERYASESVDTVGIVGQSRYVVDKVLLREAPASLVDARLVPILDSCQRRSKEVKGRFKTYIAIDIVGINPITASLRGFDEPLLHKLNDVLASHVYPTLRVLFVRISYGIFREVFVVCFILLDSTNVDVAQNNVVNIGRRCSLSTVN